MRSSLYSWMRGFIPGSFQKISLRGSGLLPNFSLLEVCQGNWKPAEEDPQTVLPLLADEEASGWIKQVPGA